MAPPCPWKDEDHIAWNNSHDGSFSLKSAQKRHLSPQANYPRCNSNLEDIFHVLRDCPFAKSVWNLLDPQNLNSLFSILIPHEWISRISGNKTVGLVYLESPSLVFGFIVMLSSLKERLSPRLQPRRLLRLDGRRS
ncbi:hypothetical protein PIB30_063896 [Stylosanthes scabra]|uniref:Reverse transcriptase zinc-binding domain-containing protein n=1 Tax=Stylosanthes scabra TaxID=79078 RepID=A0ABU6ZKB7_9FABA|nr:hypothetical protein [Stylosanthes scabra]